MFDPLSSSTAASWGGEQEPPPWPTTPHSPGSSIPNLRRAASPVPPTPDKGPSPGLYGKEPQIYGQPETGLISPRETVGSNGVRFEKAEPYLRVRINGLDRNRRDILVKLDAQVVQRFFFGGFHLANIDLLDLLRYFRPIFPTLTEQRIAMCPARIWSSNSSTTLSYTTTHRPLYLPSPLPRPLPQPTRKMTGW
jgi:hypothetical protein